MVKRVQAKPRPNRATPIAGHLRWGCRCGKRPRGGGGAGGAGVEWGVQAALAASRCALAAAAAALAFAAACCCLCRCLGLLYAKLLRLLQLRCSPTATSFFHSQKVVLKNTGLLSSAAHAQCSLSNQNDCSRCALGPMPYSRTPGCRMQQRRWRAAPDFCTPTPETVASALAPSAR